MNFIKRNLRAIAIFLAIAIILSLPLLAMQFTDQVVWDAWDFFVAGIFLFGTGLLYEFAARREGDKAYRAAMAFAVGTTLVLVWMNLAVGLIGSEDNPANLLYGGVLAVGIVGAFWSRLKPTGMARTLFAMAAAQASVPVIAFVIWRPPINPGLFGVLMLNGFFVTMFAASALLFLNSKRKTTTGRV